MIARVLVVTVLMVLALAAPWMAEDSFADTIPNYFQDERPGFACVNATTGGSTTTLLLQLNFDNFDGSIPLARADSLFARFTTSLGWLSDLLGASLQVTCTLSPSQAQATVPGLTALQAAQQLSGTFQQRGFASYLVLDSFRTVAPSYLGSDIAILRTDAFRVLGSNNLSYQGSNDVLESLLP
jgi:hypothetical protein